MDAQPRLHRMLNSPREGLELSWRALAVRKEL